MEGFKNLFAILVLVGFSSLAVEGAFDCESDGEFPNPEDCASFYHCSNDIPYLKACPKPLHFNAAIKVCDWPVNAKCTIEPNPTSTTATPEFSCIGKPNGDYPNPDDCSTFYKCSNGIRSLFDCPGDLVFNPGSLRCDYLYNVTACGGTGTPPASTIEPTTTPAPTTPSPAPSTIEPEDFDCLGKPDGKYPNPEDCRTFYKCANERTFKYDCPGETYFHPEQLTCLWFHEIPYPYCGRTTTGEPEEPTTQGQTQEPTTEGQTQEPTTEGQTEEPTEVPTDQPTQEPTAASTEPPVSSTPGNTNPPEIFDCSDKPNGWYPNPENCSTFYMCSNGYTHLMLCPADLYFNRATLICDWQYNVPECGGTEGTTVQPPTFSTTEDPDEFSCAGKCGDYPHPSNCTSFYRCQEGLKELIQCPNPLVFNPERQLCDFEENVPSCQTPPPTTEEPTVSTVDPVASTIEPVESTVEPVVSTIEPEESTVEPIVSTVEPEESTVGPVVSTIEPEESTVEPVVSTIEPEESTVEPVVSTIEPIVSTVDPIISTIEPIVSTVEPVESTVESTTSGGGGQFCDGRPDGLFPNPKNCFTYYKCSGGITYLMPCNDGLKFDKNILNCILPQHAQCAAE